MARSIMWFRRDLRLQDHPALAAAAAAGEVVPLFVVDPLFSRRSGAPRLAYLAATLAALDAEMGGALVVRHGDPADVVPRIAEQVDATDVHVSKDFGPYGRRRDAEVAARLRENGRRLRGSGSPYAVDPGTVVKADGTPYRVFTPFSKAWRAAGWSAPVEVPTVSWGEAPERSTDGVPAPRSAGCEMPPVGTEAALAHWERFVDDGLDGYKARRNLPGIEGTSRMSVALRWGTVHPRQLLHDLGDETSHGTYRNELAWREFYADVLLAAPDSAWNNLQTKMDAMPVDTDAAAERRFEAWCAGRTGFPVVDAGMRELLGLGWMHNRVRMITASFLVKDLHLPWQWGARHFMRHLLDGDLASNNHGWQWTAGTGTDAAPYFRVFNPTSQGQRFDPDGAYLRQWIPELADLPGSVIHEPGALRPASYPAPMVDHATERLEALSRYKSVTGR